MLSSEVKRFIAENQSDSGFDPSISVEQYRLAIKAYIQNADSEFIKTHEASDITVEKLKIETEFCESIIFSYKPINLASGILIPCIIYLTGGGFVYSDTQWQIRNCIDLAISTNSIVLNIVERNAPEYKFPEGLYECFSVIQWLFKNGRALGIDISDVRLCGFSSGGNFAAVLARWCMESLIPIQGQYLISPWLDLTCSHGSYKRYSKGYLLDQEVCDWLRHQYTNDSEFGHPDVSPLLFQGDLSRLAPCTLVVAEYEPFHDEVIFYAEKLKEFGIVVRLLEISGQIHEYAGCNRWRLVTDESSDPISEVGLAIKYDRSVKLSTVVSERVSITSVPYGSNVRFFKLLPDKFVIEHRHDNDDKSRIRREYDERFGMLPFSA